MEIFNKPRCHTLFPFLLKKNTEIENFCDLTKVPNTFNHKSYTFFKKS